MSITYKVKDGDSLDAISRRYLGSESNVDALLRANPEISQNLTPESLIVIPSLADRPKDRLFNVSSSNVNEVSILINNTRFRFWDSVTINRTIDSIDTVEFTAPFTSEDASFRRLFKPFSFQDVVIFVGGQTIFNGTLINVRPEITDTSKTISVSCYAKSGVLNDCNAPSSAYPLEFNKLSIIDIATKLCLPFGISVKLDAPSQGAIFERVSCDPDRKILDFLTDLAKQRNLILTNSIDGGLVFLQGALFGASVANLEQGKSPLVSVRPFFSPQDYYSHITGIEPVVTGTEGSQYTLKNSRLPSTIRPFTFQANDTLSGDVKSAVDAKAGRMFGNMLSYQLEVSTWRDGFGNLWQPNKNILLQSDDAMIYSKSEFTIRSVIFEKDANKETAKLDIVLVGSFSGIVPSRLPWD